MIQASSFYGISTKKFKSKILSKLLGKVCVNSVYNFVCSVQKYCTFVKTKTKNTKNKQSTNFTGNTWKSRHNMFSLSCLF